MKKLTIICIVLFLMYLYEQYDIIDLSKYESNTKTVEVKGEVAKPGVYTTHKNATIEEIIQLAGGINPQGDTSQINLTRNIENHGIIHITKKTTIEKISINTATLQQLDTLPGIGPSTAKRIIEYRKLHTFKQIEDIMLVKGIKEKLFAKIKDKICL